MSTFLKRSAPRPPTMQAVDIPEWGGSVKVRGLPLGLLLSAADPGKERELGVQSILACVLDEDGQPFFATREDVEQLDLPVFSRLQAAIADLSRPDPKLIEKN